MLQIVGMALCGCVQESGFSLLAVSLVTSSRHITVTAPSFAIRPVVVVVAFVGCSGGDRQRRHFMRMCRKYGNIKAWFSGHFHLRYVTCLHPAFSWYCFFSFFPCACMALIMQYSPVQSLMPCQRVYGDSVLRRRIFAGLPYRLTEGRTKCGVVL